MGVLKCLCLGHHDGMGGARVGVGWWVPGVCHSRAALVRLLELGEPHPGDFLGRQLDLLWANSLELAEVAQKSTWTSLPSARSWSWGNITMMFTSTFDHTEYKQKSTIWQITFGQ